MDPTRHALISVTDKSGVVEFAQGLVQRGFKILSTGGTYQLLKGEQIPVTEVAAFTGQPECFDGRVKTLHPKIHAGILNDRNNTIHQKEMDAFRFESIALVCVNLYDFTGQAYQKQLPASKVIQYIDIGGPTMLRGAAKNFQHVWAVSDPKDYSRVLSSLDSPKEEQVTLRQELASKVFRLIANYDAMIADELQNDVTASRPPMPKLGDLKQTLRYGENGHQKAWLYADRAQDGLASAPLLQGKELSYNNYLDLDAAAAIVRDLSPRKACAIIKHTNPCGVAVSDHSTPRELFARALQSDPKCAFGGIVAFNIPVDQKAAEALCELFLECIVAPAFEPDAMKLFSQKKNLRILKFSGISRNAKDENLTLRSIDGGVLVQSADQASIFSESSWETVSIKQPSDALIDELKFAMTIAKHVKSNAIVLAKNGMTIGIGAGQMSRIDAAHLAVKKATDQNHTLQGCVAASDAFFPFRDTVDYLANVGVTAIVQPGGSLKDEESFQAAKEHGLVMVKTGVRHFRH
jgi:phosphoribosylaminoimidazolecarboxamide formyltransferase / IMP cyclohydrolase